MGEMVAHQGQTMGWRSECYLCSVLGARRDPMKGREACSEPGKDRDP